MRLDSLQTSSNSPASILFKRSSSIFSVVEHFAFGPDTWRQVPGRMMLQAHTRCCFLIWYHRFPCTCCNPRAFFAVIAVRQEILLLVECCLLWILEHDEPRI